jgi:transcriptional regulator with XRE-family HTH domain
MAGKDTAFRRAVRGALEAKGLSLKEACAKASVTPQSAQNWMNGLAARAANRARLLEVLGLTDDAHTCPTCGKPR